MAFGATFGVAAATAALLAVSLLIGAIVQGVAGLGLGPVSAPVTMLSLRS